MDIMSFVFGVLTICSLLVAIGFVVGIVKVIRNSKKINDLETSISEVYNQIGVSDTQIIADIDQRSVEVDRQFGDIEKEIFDIRSYVDSRIDKVLQHSVNKF